MQLPATESVVPTQDLVNDALSHRAELAQARINLANTEISNKAVRNSLLPSLDLYAYYGGTGLGGNVALPACTSDAAAPSIAALIPPRRRRRFRNGGPVSYGSALSQLVIPALPTRE